MSGSTARFRNSLGITKFSSPSTIPKQLHLTEDHLSKYQNLNFGRRDTNIPFFANDLKHKKKPSSSETRNYYLKHKKHEKNCLPSSNNRQHTVHLVLYRLYAINNIFLRLLPPVRHNFSEPALHASLSRQPVSDSIYSILERKGKGIESELIQEVDGLFSSILPE